jgi:hypothetical protein
MDEAERACHDEAEAPAWESSLERRRDLPAHRGHLFRFWSAVATMLNVMSMWAFFLAPLAVPLALLLWWTAAHDLRKMRAGEMDPRGEEQTAAARTDARVCLIFPVIGCLLWAGWYAAIVFRIL